METMFARGLKEQIDEYQKSGAWKMVDVQPCGWLTKVELFPARFMNKENRSVTEYLVTFKHR